jgi:hypothetical protein
MIAEVGIADKIISNLLDKSPRIALVVGCIMLILLIIIPIWRLSKGDEAELLGLLKFKPSKSAWTVKEELPTTPRPNVFSGVTNGNDCIWNVRKRLSN